ncbi:hypothetical protein HK101_002537 [Irineochytrium annulatum]|nr:hypothetical protein HK101_002537 [Irineochytrium annulatum]
MNLGQELWEQIFVYLADPAPLLLTCRSTYHIGNIDTIRVDWLLKQHGPTWISLFSQPCFEPFDSISLETLTAALDDGGEAVAQPVGATAASRRAGLMRSRLFKLLRIHEVTLRVLTHVGDTLDEMMLMSSSLVNGALSMATSSKPSRAAKRLLRFVSWSGNVAAINHLLDTCPTLANNRRELSIAAAYAINTGSVRCLLPILVRRPALERNEHLAFCEAIRTDQVHVAELLMDYYYKGIVKERRELAHSARNRGMLWVGKPLTLHYLLNAGASMLYFDWDYFAERSLERKMKLLTDDFAEGDSDIACEDADSLFRELLAVLIHHLAAGRIELEDFAEEAILAGASRSDIVFLESLLSLGLDLSEGGEEALQSAASFGQLPAVQWLLDHCVDPTHDDSAALRVASARGYAPIVRLLASRGADISARSNEPLLRASANGYAPCVTALIDHGADVSHDHNAALRAACSAGHADVVDVLMRSGADVMEALGVSERVMQVIVGVRADERRDRGVDAWTVVSRQEDEEDYKAAGEDEDEAIAETRPAPGIQRDKDEDGLDLLARGFRTLCRGYIPE